MLGVIRAPRCVGVFLLVLGVMSARVANGQTTAFTYQGQLSDAGALANNSYDLRFALFDSAMGGAPIVSMQDVPGVPVKDGVFTVQLDFGVNAFPGANRFVEIGVKPAGGGSFTTLAPRQQISSSPYAIRTLSAATADALSSACVGCVQDAQIQGVAGSKVNGTIPAASLPTGSGNYIQNTTAQQATSNFNIAGNGVVGGNLTVAGTLNANVSGNFIQNRTTQQAGANFNVGGTGTVGGVLSAGSVGIGTATPAAGVLLDVEGNTRLTPGGSGGFMQLGTPGGETGLSFAGATSRADLRFNDSTLKLVAGPNGGPPAASSGVAINTAGSVGIGIANPTTGRLHVVGDANTPAIYGESANRGVWGHSTGASRGVYGDSVSGEGVHGESASGTGVAGLTASANIASPGVGGASTGNGGVGVRGDGTTGVYGKSTSPGGIGVNGTATSPGGAGVYGESALGWAMSAAGNTSQSHDKGGWVKAMVSVDTDGTIIRCFNSLLAGSAATTVPCGFDSPVQVGGAPYNIDFGLVQVGDRFISVTSSQSGNAPTSADFSFLGPNKLSVTIYTFDEGEARAPFMVIVF